MCTTRKRAGDVPRFYAREMEGKARLAGVIVGHRRKHPRARRVPWARRPLRPPLRRREAMEIRYNTNMAMVEIQPIRVELEREEDGRILASVPDLPGVMAYGASEEEAVRTVKSIALQVLADMIESGEEVPRTAEGPLCRVSTWRATKAKQSLCSPAAARLDSQEAGRVTLKAATSRLVQLHILLSRQRRSRSGCAF